MREGEPSEIREHICAVLAAVNDGRMRAHLIWEIKEIMSHVRPEDMTDCELAAAIAVLHAAHARVLVPPPVRRPILRVVSQVSSA